MRIAMGQMLVEPGSLEANLSRARRMIEDAAARRCQIILLPECLDLGWLASCATELARPLPGPTSDRLAAAARKHRIHVVAGLTEREGDRLFNAAILLSDSGEMLLKYRKIIELRFGAPHDIYATGDRLAVAHTPLGCIGVSICADNYPGQTAIAHTLGRMGAQLLLSPCAWAVPPEFDNTKTPYGEAWLRSYSQLAKLYQMPVFGVSNVGPVTSGPWAGWRCIGNSLAVGADGQVLAWGPHGICAQELLTIDLQLAPRPHSGTDLIKHLRRQGWTGE
jgi:predicted amidohydrolase